MAPKKATVSSLVPLRVMQRIIVWFCLKEGATPTDTFRRMLHVFGRRTMNKRTVFHWHKNFRDGRRAPVDLPRSGRPKSARTPQNIQRCHTLVQADRRVGIHRLSRQLQVSYGTVQYMLHKDLHLCKKAAKMIPHVLTPVQRERRMDFSLDFIDRFGADRKSELKWIVTCDEAWFHVLDPNTKIENMQWLHKTDPRPQVAMRSRSAAKVMLIPFFDQQGLLHWEYFENQTITKKVFLPLLTRVKHSMRIRRGAKHYQHRHKYMLHMDNAPAHASDLVQQGLNSMQWPILEHPPYSPDLSPCDFFLFPYLKRQLRGRQFPDTNMLRLEIDRLMGLITVQQWQDVFKDWLHRCEKCLHFDGNYFEGYKMDE